jgi:hypothetical protein
MVIQYIQLGSPVTLALGEDSHHVRDSPALRSKRLQLLIDALADVPVKLNFPITFIKTPGLLGKNS